MRPHSTGASGSKAVVRPQGFGFEPYPPDSDNLRSISLALSGGGARGFAHVGVLKAFTEERLHIAELSGSSMGAIIATYYAVHGDLGPLEAFARSLNRRTMLRYFDPCPPPHSLMKGKQLRRVLTQWFGDRRIEDARIPLSILVTELRTGKAIALREGSIVDALMASSAIPGLLPAVEIRGEHYVDGGVSQPLPIDALRKRNTLRVGVSLRTESAPRRFAEQPRLIEVLTLVYETSRQHLHRQPKNALIITPNIGTARDVLAFHRSAEFLQHGEKAAREAMPGILVALRAEQKNERVGE